jgi:hypothetical protein
MSASSSYPTLPEGAESVAYCDSFIKNRPGEPKEAILLDLAGLKAEAKAIRAAAPIVDAKSAKAAQKALDSARSAAAGDRAAAWAAARGRCQGTLPGTRSDLRSSRSRSQR